MSDGFLARWSRRKRDEARRIPEAAPEAAPPTAPGAIPGEILAEDEVSLSPEELAQLPPLDALTAATDLAPFLRAGVPRALRNAALRRMWSIDPAIRDFVSEAREYAYDWNTPGGVPGTGGAISAEDVRAMVEKVFGGGGEKPPAAVSNQTDVAEIGTPLSSPRERAEGVISPVGGEASSGPAVRREGEGVSAEGTHPETPPHPRADPYGIDAPRRFDDDKVVEAFSPPAGRGDAHRPPELPSLAEPIHPHPSARPEPPAPPRLRRHGGALPI